MGLRRGEIFLAPPYYCQRAEFASERFFIFTVLLFFFILHLCNCTCCAVLPSGVINNNNNNNNNLWKIGRLNKKNPKTGSSSRRKTEKIDADDVFHRSPLTLLREGPKALMQNASLMRRLSTRCKERGPFNSSCKPSRTAPAAAANSSVAADVLRSRFVQHRRLSSALNDPAREERRNSCRSV